MTEQWATDEERWCEVCQDEDEDRERFGVMPLTVPTTAWPFRVCADCAEAWDEMQEEA